ncbi:hypothetical protein FM996_21195 [Methylosinus sporium]|uniref:Uncharacterized protein n=1 Tax=Methylosinus sporium TaxID=428 RepID=A0A549SCT1_METSR|nr:hypothetical protein [Methylosinus sporium]TRL22639.1 hypothetical protein FM996_21195 [Methylosinus sporium]
MISHGSEDRLALGGADRSGLGEIGAQQSDLAGEVIQESTGARPLGVRRALTRLPIRRDRAPSVGE